MSETNNAKNVHKGIESITFFLVEVTSGSFDYANDGASFTDF